MIPRTVHIPRVIHRIWLDETMPAQFGAFGGTWARLHPEWGLIDWCDSKAVPPLINKALFDDARTWYPHDWVRFRADILRLELLWRFGGLYVDADVEPHRAIDGLLDGQSCVVGRSPQGDHAITNAVMAAVPQHPFVGACIEGLASSVAQYRGHRLAMGAGPHHLDRTYQQLQPDDVTVLSSAEMYGGHWLTHHWNTAARKRGSGVW